MASLEDVMLALGRVQEGVENLRSDFRDEKKSAQSSRAAIHARLDAHAKEISGLREDIGISGQIDAQIREELKSHKAATEPSIEEWRRMKALGTGVATLIAFAGLTTGALMIWVGDAVVAAIRHWLKIN
jgi:hypothetical protein